MKNLVDIFFVKVPFVISVLLQIIFLLIIYSSSEAQKVAFHGKLLFPIIVLIAVILHFRQKKEHER